MKLIFIVPAALAIASFAAVISDELLDDYYYTVTPWLTNDVEGDKDGFGMGLDDGDYRPADAPGFDAREFDDPYFTDVWPIPSADPGVYWFSYRHIFEPPPGPFNAKLKLFTLGIQDGDSQVAGSDTDIRLYADGLEVMNAFDDVDQFYWEEGVGWVESVGYVVLEIPADIAHVLLDGYVEFSFEVLQLGTHPGNDSFAIDYSELVIEPTPISRIEILSSTVAALDIPGGLENSLAATLSSAIQLFEDENPDNDSAGINKLMAFLNKVNAKTGKDISESDADYLTGQVLDILAALAGDERCPCWGYSDIYSLPIEGTTAACQSDHETRIDILQIEVCEHSYGVLINRSDASLNCVVNRFDCPGLSDLGVVVPIDGNEFYLCLDQIQSRCEDLGIDPPEFP